MDATSPGSGKPSADLSVRLGWVEDAVAIGTLQLEAWRERHAHTLPDELLASLEPAEFAEVWARSIARPRDARQRVLVALERNTVRGFAAIVPSTDPDADPVADAELTELEVAIDARQQGHGSRLLHAVADTMRADRFTRATSWLDSEDDDRREFLEASGWAPDGAHRQLDLDGDGVVRVKQIRLHTDLLQP